MKSMLVRRCTKNAAAFRGAAALTPAGALENRISGTARIAHWRTTVARQPAIIGCLVFFARLRLRNQIASGRKSKLLDLAAVRRIGGVGRLALDVDIVDDISDR